MPDPSLEDLCELGQRQLMQTQYLEAQATLVRAEQLALDARNWDVLSRLYMPLQETRRQIRQTCGEGIVRLDVAARGPSDQIDPDKVIEQYPMGQLLVAGWETVEPAVRVRRAAAESGLYLETFLGAACPTADAGIAVAVVPLADTILPAPIPRSLAELSAELPPGSILLRVSDLPAGPRQGTFVTYGQTMALWERLHAPFLAQADSDRDLVRKVELYRQTIRVDSACELAHQKLSAVAHELARIALEALNAPLI